MAVATALGYGTPWFLFIWTLLAILIALGHFWARAVVGAFALVVLLTAFQEHRPVIAVIAVLLAVLAYLPHRLLGLFLD